MIAVYAHRGFHRFERENTLGAFREAVAIGVDGVELDVRRTRDGVLVVNHDPEVEGLIIARTRRAELPEHVATLEEALAVLSGVRVNVEIKNSPGNDEPAYDSSGEFVRQVLEQLAETGWSDQVIVSCFDDATCARVRELDETMPVGWLLWGIPLSSAMVRARALGLDAVHPHFSTVSRAGMDQARQLGLEVNVWTVNDPDEVARVAALGVSSIITDDPELVRRVLAGAI